MVAFLVMIDAKCRRQMCFINLFLGRDWVVKNKQKILLPQIKVFKMCIFISRFFMNFVNNLGYAMIGCQF